MHDNFQAFISTANEDQLRSRLTTMAADLEDWKQKYQIMEREFESLVKRKEIDVANGEQMTYDETSAPVFVRAIHRTAIRDLRGPIERTGKIDKNTYGKVAQDIAAHILHVINKFQVKLDNGQQNGIDNQTGS